MSAATQSSETAGRSRYDVLFEPVRIGPLTTKNRFFQVPHCNGMGYRDPSAEAAMRRVKAEGGWAVVCTEQVEIHPTSDIAPFIELRIWDEQDLPALARIADAIHEGGALAGIELAHNGLDAPNLYSRETPLAPAHLPVATFTSDPVQARAMTKADIADLRRWHRTAVRRSLQAGYDLVYVYAAHALGGIHHFLSPRYNQRTDEYGGSALNRMRLLREILEETYEEVSGRAAVACRITIDELLGDAGISRPQIEEILGELGEYPDLWDFVLGSWEDDSNTSRFGPEGEQEE
jgi:dimethylamine/trimethylamine dehydrogenase